MKKVLLVATVQSHICQFHKPLVELLHEHGSEVHVAARNNLVEKNGLKLDFVEKVFDIPFQRSPFSLKNIKAYRALKKVIRQGDYDIIHCNTPVAGVLTRMAAKKARKQGAKVIYTAHGFHFYRGASKKNWLVWYPIEKHFAKKCDTLITICKEDFQLAKKKFKTNVERIHGVGVDDTRFHPVSEEESVSMRSAVGLKKEDFVLLCVGELNKNKNQKTLIDAVVLLKNRIPNLKVLLAGNGPKECELRTLISQYQLENQVLLLGYRTDLEKILPSVNLAVSCSKREGLGLNIIEAMLCGKPVVASKNRGHIELISEGENGYLLNHDDVTGFAERIYDVYQNAGELGKVGLIRAKEYTASEVKKELESIYFGE